jgi:PAS domain S-box-containing protein
LDSVLDIVFRFPPSDHAGADFVVPLLNFAQVPILAVDRRARVRLSNLQGEELLLRLGSDGAGKGRRGGSRGFPSNLKGSIAGCLKAGRAMLVPEAGVKGVLGGSLEALLCPGEVSGVELVFIVLQAPQLGTTRNMGAVLDQLLNSFDAPVVIVDSDMRFRALNRSYATVFGLDPLEAIGARIRDINPSKQAEVLEDQIRHLMATRQIRNSKADRLTTSKHGAVVAAISAWPVCDGPERCGGIAAIVRPVAPQAMDVETDVTSEHVFGQAAATMGPPMFLTHLDRTILIANAQGKALLRDDSDEKDLGAAIAWRHPGIIEKLYDDIAGGSGYSAILTEIEMPAGTGVFRVAAHALKEIGDITSQVLIHLVDVTDAEQMRGILSSTVRNLATEKAILSKTIEGIQVAYAVVDRDLRILRVSDSVSKGFGLPLEAFVGKKVQEVDPTAGEKGIVGCIKAAIDRGHEVRLPRLAYTIRPSGRHVVLALSFFPRA